MARYRLGKWRHPKTEEVRIYLNGLDSTEAKVWFQKGERRGDQLPPEFGIKLCCEDQSVLNKQEVVEEIAEAFSEMDLFLDKTTWSRLGRAASW